MSSHAHHNPDTDALTKEAWEKNWEGITMDSILEIFKYRRVQKQMELYQRVLPKNDRILEGGCGLGPYLIRLRQLGYNVEGIDYNEGPIRKIKSFDASLPVQVGDVTKIPFADNTFGGYLSLGVIEHFTEGPEKAIREARRVLKPGGVFVCAVPRNHLFMRLEAPLRWAKSWTWLRKLLKKPLDTHYWEQYFPKEKLRRIIEKEGFEVREVHPMDHAHAIVSTFGFLRDKTTYDEAGPFALKAGAWCEKHLPWITAAQMTYICYKK